MSFNLAVILSETAHSSPDRPVAVFTGGQLTYRELDKASDRLAASLVATGMRPGDPVALQLPNIPQFLTSYFGILKAGGVVVPLNVMLRAPEVAFHLDDSGAGILITWEGVLAEAAKGAEAAGLDQIYAVGHAGDSGGAVRFERLLDVTVPTFEMATRQPTDTAVIVYTSGTTGRPKGAELTHIQLYMNADIPGRLFNVQPDDIVIAVLPLFHVFGLSSIMDVCVRFGCTMSLIPRFTPAAVLAAIQRDRATIFEGVPTMFADLLSCPDLDSYDLSSLRVAISGGASIPAPVLDAFEERLGLVILEGYGMTETALTITFNPSADERRAYSVGKPIWGTQTQVWDENSQPLPPGPGHVGEVVTRGLHVMKGYLHDPEATAGTFTGDWLHTGDLGYFDRDGFNRVSAVLANLPAGEPDPIRRLSLIRQEMDGLKHTHQAVSAEILTAMLGFAAPMWLALGTQAAFRIRQPLVQTVTTNVPGPRSPLYLLGRRLMALYPYVPIGNTVRISVAILSYIDTMSFGVTADYDSSPDLDVFVEGIRRSLAELSGPAAS